VIEAPIAAELRKLPHFRLAGAESLERLAAAVRRRTLASGESVFFEREPARAFYAVQQGGVRLYRLRPDGKEQVIHLLGPGQTFAEAAVLSFDFYPVSAVATEAPTVLLEVPGDAVRRLMREDEKLAAAMVGSLSMRLLELVGRVEELTSASAAARLAGYLLKLPAIGPAARPTVDLGLARKDLAGRLGIAPETLSRVMRRWEEAGLVDAAQRTVVLLDPGRLLAIADGEEAAPR
jgi:CRP/FNR family transcriptional regulator